jgi:hypothetical protein
MLRTIPADPALAARVLDELRRIQPFPSRSDGRMNVRRAHDDYYMHFCMGLCRKRDVPHFVESAFNRQYPALHNALKDLMRAADPSFVYDAVQLNKCYRCAPHMDKNNDGPSYIVGLGQYEGGALLLGHARTPFDIRGVLLKFDGSRTLHETAPFTGERYTAVFYKARLCCSIS